MMSMLYHALLLGYYLPYPFMTTLMLAVVFLSNIHIYDLIMEGGGVKITISCQKNIWKGRGSIRWWVVG